MSDTILNFRTIRLALSGALFGGALFGICGDLIGVGSIGVHVVGAVVGFAAGYGIALRTGN